MRKMHEYLTVKNNFHDAAHAFFFIVSQNEARFVEKQEFFRPLSAYFLDIIFIGVCDSSSILGLDHTTTNPFPHFPTRMDVTCTTNDLLDFFISSSRD